MKKQIITISACMLMISTLTGCEIVGGIFKVGMVWGIILVVLVIFGIIFLISRGRKK